MFRPQQHRACWSSLSQLVPALFALMLLVGCSNCAGGSSTQEPPETRLLPRIEAPLTLPAPEAPPVAQAPGPAPRDLTPLFDALRAIESGRPGATATMLFLGDSHTASDTTTGELRDLMQGRFGDGGRGFAQPGRPWRSFRQESMRRDPSPFPIGLSGVIVVASEADAVLTRGTCDSCSFGARFDTLLVHALQHPAGGSFDVIVDDQIMETISTQGLALALDVLEFDLPDGHHVAEIRTVGDGAVVLSGIATERSAGGMIVDSLGLNGARSAHWNALERTLVVSEVSARQPDLIVHGFGTNEAFGGRFRMSEALERHEGDMAAALQDVGDATLAYSEDVERLLRTLLAGAPEAGCLVMLPPDFHDSDAPCLPTTGSDRATCNLEPPDALGRVVGAQRQAADRVGCAVWDGQAAMGGPGAMSDWQRSRLGRDDGIHLTMRGYDTLAEGLYADLLRGYEVWRVSGVASLEATAIELGQEGR
jgi:lysophospholipase L1-like esterase